LILKIVSTQLANLVPLRVEHVGDLIKVTKIKVCSKGKLVIL